jgi:hypothetical protein
LSIAGFTLQSGLPRAVAATGVSRPKSMRFSVPTTIAPIVCSDTATDTSSPGAPDAEPRSIDAARAPAGISTHAMPAASSQRLGLRTIRIASRARPGSPSRADDT